MPHEDGDGTRLVLLTQCLQNDFFLNRECRLILPEHVMHTMLAAKRDLESLPPRTGHAGLPEEIVRRSPLGVFLEATIGRRRRGEPAVGTLHVINIRDWHTPGQAYDLERRAYGSHCERGTWGAQYLEGFGSYLDPNGSGSSGEEATYFEAGSVRIYHVHSDSVFDFKPREDEGGRNRLKYEGSQLEDVLDVIVQGSEDDVEEMRAILRDDPRLEAIHELGRRVDDDEPGRNAARTYVAVIGVHTDIKVQTLLGGLRTRYGLPNLAVSDTLTASSTLERHLAGLDSAAKVMDVEVIHGVNDLVRFLGCPPPLETEADTVAAPPFSRYRSFFQDKQNVLAYQDEKLREYLTLTERRSIDVYERIKKANAFLIWFGSAFLVVTLVGAVASAIWPDRFDWKLPLVTGGVGLLQLVSAFYSKPIRDLQKNLTNLAAFKMILESHSLKTAFARFHLTTPQTLRELKTPEEAEEAARQVAAFQQQVEAIQAFDTADFEGLAKLAFASEAVAGNGDAEAVKQAAEKLVR